MATSLLRTGLLLLLWLVLGALPSAASHLVGGELTYRYINSRGPAATPHQYELIARVYFNKEPGSSAPDGSPSIRLTVFSRAANGALLAQENVPIGSATQITPTTPPGCSITTPRVTLGVYYATISLPTVPEGYLATFSATARNAGITNIANSQNESMTISADMTPPTIPNSSPAFSSNAIAAICLGDTSVVLNNAYDADGDRLSYSLATPASSAVQLPVSYLPGYSSAQPFGTPGLAAVDAGTGLARYFCLTQGTFLLAIDVAEYRTINGQEVLLGKLRRDIQIVVRACGGAPNQAPVFTAGTSAQRNFVVAEGQQVSFAATAADPERQGLNMSVSSVLLDGPSGVDATVNGLPGNGTSANSVGTVVVSGTGSVSASFRLRAGCGLARATPYDVVVTVADAVCGSKTIAAVFRITVTRLAPPTGVRGDSALCAQRVVAYSALGPAFAEYRWRVQGGRVRGPATGRTVQVEWLSGGANKVAVRGITPDGCPTDSAVQAVAVIAGPPVAGPTDYCRKASTGLRYTIAGPPAAYQWSIANGTLVSGQGTNEVIVDVPPGATAVLQAANPAQTPCITTVSIALDDSCLVFYNIITPNGDGQNDVFVIENIERHPNTALTVFNRWGRRVYQSGDYRNSFGGQGEGPGMYYYLCQLADGTAYKGWFEIVR